MFFKKLSQAKIKIPENKQAMFILKAGKAGDKLENHKFISSLNRGGLCAVTRGAQLIFERSEHYFRLASSDWTTHKIDCSSVASKTVVDVDVVTAYSNWLSNSELEIPSNVGKDMLHNIVWLYTRVRSYSFAKDIIQKHKVRAKQLKSKGLRKEISRASHAYNNEQERQD